MSLQNFRSYQLAVRFHLACKGLKLPSYLKDQLLRSSSSVALNIAEGSAEVSRLADVPGAHLYRLCHPR